MRFSEFIWICVAIFFIACGDASHSRNSSETNKDTAKTISTVLITSSETKRDWVLGTSKDSSLESKTSVHLQRQKNDESETLSGIFSFGMARFFPQSASLKLPYINGMTAYYGWDQIEYKEGEFDFRGIDSLLSWAKKNNKILNLGFYGGCKSPEWIYKKNVDSISWKRKLRDDQAKMRKASMEELSTPVPWDKEYLTYWKRFISEVAKKYGKEASVGYISLTGATPKDLSTGTVIRQDSEWNKFLEKGYTHQIHVDAWKDLIEYYQKVLPDKVQVLAIGPLRPGSDNVQLSEELVDYVIDKKYKNVKFLCVFLNNTWFETGAAAKDIRSLLKKAQKSGHNFGYQMVQSAHRTRSKFEEENRVITDLRKSLDIGIRDGASWIEVWHDDIIDPEFKKVGKVNSLYSEDLKWAGSQFNLKKSDENSSDK